MIDSEYADNSVVKQRPIVSTPNLESIGRCLTTWRNKYLIKKIEAKALVAGQPEVLINFEFIEIATRKEFSYGIKCEVRWSHGKFCGNPESKLYKYNHWKYEDLPWVNVL